MPSTPAGRRPVRRKLLGVATAAILASMALSGRSLADTATVPPGLQVELFAKVADYDRSLPGRSVGVVRVVVVSRRGVPESASAAARVLHALSGMTTLSGLPHEEIAVDFTDAGSLAELCKSRSISILYMSPGLTDVDESVSNALAGLPVLSISSTPDGVAKGMVLGFDLVGGKPRLMVSRSAMKRQGVRLSPELLNIATVIE
jgi:hypothetical protein